MDTDEVRKLWRAAPVAAVAAVAAHDLLQRHHAILLEDVNEDELETEGPPETAQQGERGDSMVGGSPVLG